MLAGQRLVSSRRESYDFPDGQIDETYYDPTRKKDFDLADAFQMAEISKQSLKASQTAQETRKEADKIANDLINAEKSKASTEA